MHKTFLTIGCLLLAGCTAAPPKEVPADPHAMHRGHIEGAAPVEKWSIEDASTENAIQFAVLNDEGNRVMHYEVSHTKEMHLIVVRDDLRHFFHLHPEKDSEGMWSVPFNAPAGGTYWIYADFVASGPHTIKFERHYTGSRRSYGMEEDMTREKQVGDFTVKLSVRPSAQNFRLHYEVSDSQGASVVFEPYLGAAGHTVLLSTNGDFIHTHPVSEEALHFVAENVKDDVYRIFTQFQVEGELYTVSFDWKRFH